MNLANPNECLVLVDGYNLYYHWNSHIFELHDKGALATWDTSKLRKKYRTSPGEWLWYDMLALLAEPVRTKMKGSEIGKLYYCSAPYSKTKTDSTRIQNAFVGYHQAKHPKKFARKTGHFSKYEHVCVKCGHTGRREKQTDVNIALTCVEEVLVPKLTGAAQCYNAVVIVSDDSDFIPITPFLKRHGIQTFTIKPSDIDEEYLVRANFSAEVDKFGGEEEVPSPHKRLVKKGQSKTAKQGKRDKRRGAGSNWW